MQATHILSENLLFSILAGSFISFIFCLASRRQKLIPGRLQAFAEFAVGSIDELFFQVLGKNNRKYLPFLGTLFIYILVSNLMGFIPLMKSPTASLSTTFALSLCVFIYVQYTAARQFGLRGYLDHLMGSPRGAIASTVVIPLFMLALHILTELIRPVSLALRLRSNIFGDELLLSAISGSGFFWLPLLFFIMLLSIIAAVVQALVFTLLSAVYFALVLPDEEGRGKQEKLVSTQA